MTVRALRTHFARVGFSPNSFTPDQEVEAALRQIQHGEWCNNLGCTFASSRLSTKFGIIARPRQIKRLLARLDPEQHAKRKTTTARLGYVYTVAGPRSLYHCDAHEKLAKLWGFWFHLCIDGYSRFILYLTVTDNKRSSTVGFIFVSACNHIGWASRVRWDRGKENVKAIQAQWEHWWDDALTQAENERRGSALTGRSMHNARAEYIWAFVKKHVSGCFRTKFRRMEKELNILDPSDARDLFCLHAVFISVIQSALDDFRDMWNNHMIRGVRTECGHGGGRPSELFLDPIGSASLLQRDDDFFYADPSEYGVDEPYKVDTAELDIIEAPLQDPLASWPSLQTLRTAYFIAHPFHAVDPADDYLTFKLISLELTLYCEHVSGGGNWDTFSSARSPFFESQLWDLRCKLAALPCARSG